jgi:hypothetical protein
MKFENVIFSSEMCFLNLVLICHLLEIYAEKNILVNDLHVENIVQAIKKNLRV